VTLFLQQLFNGVALGSVYALFAVGFSLVFGVMGMLNVAYGSYASVGGLVALLAATATRQPAVPALIIGALVGGAVGMVSDQVAFERIRRRGAELLAPMIASIGLWTVLETGLQVVTKASNLAFPDGEAAAATYHVAAVIVPLLQLSDIVAVAAITALLYAFLTRTRFGSSIRAVGFSPAAAAIAGVNTRVVVVATAFIAAAVGALAGGIAALTTNSVTFNLGDDLLVKGFAAVVVGGYGNVPGAYVGGLLIGVAGTMGGQYIAGGRYGDAVIYGLLLIVLLIRPQGIFRQVEFLRD
jgi:branched-chain amino acid transport system permease protein